MTSPAQLKYLDAMGIPVWVSRDLIIAERLISEVAPTSSNIQINTTAHLTAKPIDSNSSSAQNILDSLNDNSSKRTIHSSMHSPTAEIKTSLDAAVTQSVNSAKLTENPSFVPPTAPIPSSTVINQNLLFKSSQHYVYASGSESADWMVIGHSPESFNGIGQEPFAGEDGELLNNMLRAVGIESPRTQAYLLNVIDIDQAAAIDEQIQLKLKQDLLAVIDKIKPKIVLFVGQIAAQNLLNSSEPLIIMRSKVHKISAANIPSIVTYYPSYLLQKPIDKRKAWDDLKLAMSQLT